jgi:hypothetical protein
METIMRKTNETFGDHGTLADSELGTVTGGWFNLGYRAATNSSVMHEDIPIVKLLDQPSPMIP